MAATPVNPSSLAGSLDDPAPQLRDDGLAGDADLDITLPEEAPLRERELEDGSFEIDLEDEQPLTRESSSFDENLAEVLDPSFIGKLTRRYLDLVEQDIDNRKQRDKQYADGLDRAGLSDTTKGGADFDGATRVVHPMLAKACIEFQSRAIKELMPAAGPAKTKIIGNQTEDKVEKADRKRSYMNWQTTTQIEEYRAVLERLLSQVPMAGAQYKRWWWDPELRRPRTEVVYLDDVFLPYGQTDFYTSPRVTYRQKVMFDEFERRIRTELYRDLGLIDPSFLTDETKTQSVIDKQVGAEPNSTNTVDGDTMRVIYQIEALDVIEGDPYSDGRAAPYILHIDKDSEELLGLYRNWSETDERMRKKHWMSEWEFIPWRGGPALGFAAIIGGMSISATGALRALLDSAQINNFPGGLRMKGAQASGQNVQPAAGQLAEISAPAGALDPDIRKLVMPFPFNGPSDVLFKLLEWLTQQAEGVVAVASERISEASGDMAMGTALALIEHGSANFRAVHARLHAAMAKDLEILHRLNAENMTDEETVADLGDLVVYRSDFEGPMDVQPVSDPNIFSEAQRYAQIQAIMQLKADPQFAPLFKPDQLLARALRILGVDDIDAIANLPHEPKRLGAVDENYALAMQEAPLKAYRDQDHTAHLRAHVLFSTSQVSGGNPLVAAGALQGMLQHCKEHMMMLWREHIKAAQEAIMLGFRQMGYPSVPDEELQVQASALADQQLAKDLSQIVLPGLQQMQAMLGKIAENAAPKADPNVTLQEATKKEIAQLQNNTKASLDQLSTQMDAMLTKADNDSTERLAKLATAIDLVKQQMQDSANQTLEQLRAENAENLAVLNALLASVGNNQKASLDQQNAEQQQSADMEGNIQTYLQGVVQKALQEMSKPDDTQRVDALQQSILQIIEAERATNAQAFAELARGMAQLRKPRIAETFTGPDGRKRARSYYEDEGPPQ